ncbi:MAG: hypothetical protein J0M29_04385 [Chitinophagales bacterium]|nr:hypothetical protein [Chitinophagales bacterium]
MDDKMIAINGVSIFIVVPKPGAVQTYSHFTIRSVGQISDLNSIVMDMNSLLVVIRDRSNIICLTAIHMAVKDIQVCLGSVNITPIIGKI